MDHETAIQIKASSRYLVGDLSPVERDDFEEHLSDCTRCLDEVWTASVFAANAKAVFRDRAARAPAPKKAAWSEWFWPRLVPALAALCLAAFVIYQNAFVMPGLKAPQSVATAVILDGETRAGIPQVAAGQALRFQMALDHAPAGGRVIVELADASGKVVSRGPVTSPGPNQVLDVYFPGKLHSGRYFLVVRADEAGQPGPELTRNQFEVVSQETRTQ
jgi:hypothetical protein